MIADAPADRRAGWHVADVWRRGSDVPRRSGDFWHSVPVMGLWVPDRIDHCIIDVSVTLIQFPKAKS